MTAYTQKLPDTNTSKVSANQRLRRRLKSAERIRSSAGRRAMVNTTVAGTG